MNTRKFAPVLALVIATSAGLRADVIECNWDPCNTKIVTVHFEHRNTGQIISSFNYDVPVLYGQCVELMNHLMYMGDQTLECTYSVYAITFTPTCGTVVRIDGLPNVVCVGETYELTAVGNGLPFSQGVQWGGDGQVLSQDGDRATVRFNNPGSNLVMWAQATQQRAAGRYTKNLKAVSVFYTILRGPNLPPSVPFNKDTEVQVLIMPSIGSDKLKFKLIGGGSNTGQAQIIAPADLSLSGTGRNLTLRGTQMTYPGSSGQLHICTDTKPGSSCQQSVGFSVCAHPTYAAFQTVQTFNAQPSGNITIAWGAAYGASFGSDSGQPTDLGDVRYLEVITQGSRQGFFTLVPFNTNTNPNFVTSASIIDTVVIGLLNPANQQYYSGPAIQPFVDQLGNGIATDNQIIHFSCHRCGISESGSAPVVPNSGFRHTFEIGRQDAIYYIRVRKDGVAQGNIGPGTSISPPNEFNL